MGKEWEVISITMSTCLCLGNIELLKFLLTREADVESQSDAGTPLIWAAGHGQPNAVEILLEHNANVSFLLYLYYVVIDLNRVFSSSNIHNLLKAPYLSRVHGEEPIGSTIIRKI